MSYRGRRRVTYGQKDVASDNKGERDDEGPVPTGNLIFVGYKFGGEDYHHDDGGEANAEGKPEAVPYARY